ncbi:hypothetical protein GPALN_014926 [Globodera pallida]|nr:hypothetical protein GPALN_014926 [Globodera pallida]
MNISKSQNLSSSPMNSVPMFLRFVLLIACFLLLMSGPFAMANDDVANELAMRGTQQFFRRNAKWTNLPSGGGSLVSGRGNFRPGFHSSLRYLAQLSEPSFAFKRSPQHFPMMMDELELADNFLGTQ